MTEFKLIIESEKDFLSARVIGVPPDYSAAYDTFATLASTSCSARYKRLLIECDLDATAADTGEKVVLAAMNDFLRMSHGIRVAIVSCNETLVPDLAQTISELRRTGVDVHYFKDRGLAEAWVVSGSIQPWPPVRPLQPSRLPANTATV